MPKTIDQQMKEALDLLPVEGEVEFDTYKAQLYAANPDGGKEAFTNLLKNHALNRRVDFSTRPVTVYLARKAE